MYSYEERMKAVALYVKCNNRAVAATRELGYPSPRMLTRWYKEYLASGDLHRKYVQQPKYSPEEKKAAVNYYLSHGCSIALTIRTLGYPARWTLMQWIDEYAPGERKTLARYRKMVQFSYEQKKDAVIDFSVRDGSAEDVANAIPVSRETLYAWRRQLLGEEYLKQMKQEKRPPLPDDKAILATEVESLKKQIYRQQMELDVLRKAAEIIKKDPGIDPKRLTNKEKTKLIDALRKTYTLNELLMAVDLPKSSYFYQKDSQSKPDKYADLRILVKRIFTNRKRRYGYRRIHNELGYKISEKVIRRIMMEEQLVAKGRKNRRYNSYAGEITPAVDNIVNRDFKSDAPNVKWLTDITEFHIPAGKIYLSPLIDCFDGMVVSWTIGTSPNAELVNTMLDNAIALLDEGQHPVVHSDRGGPYRWPGWIDRMEKAALTRSMSKKGCTPDNSACEGFFGRLKNEMFYDETWLDTTIEQFVDDLNEYIIWYNEERTKLLLGGMSPVEYRKTLGLVA